MLASGELPPADVFTGLHACGALSDLILAHAVANGAGFCVCTCCFMSNRQLPLPAAALQPFAASPGSMPRADSDATFGASAVVTRDEWLGVPPLEVEALLRVAELQASPANARSAAHTVNALRATAAERGWAARWGDAPRRVAELAPERSSSAAGGAVAPALSVKLTCFEKKFSPKNFVLVGQPAWRSTARGANEHTA